MEKQLIATSTGSTDLLAKLTQIDGFTVDWAGRSKDGHYELAASQFRVITPVAELLGQNIADFGFEEAMGLASDSEPESHDFGECTIRRGSLRKLPNGQWAMDLTVPVHNRRKPDAVFLQDILDDDGNVINEEHVLKPKTEAWITVQLSQVEPLVGEDYPLSARYVQRDNRTAAALRVNAESERIASSKKAKGGARKGQKRAKSERVSPSAIRAMMAKREG